MLLAARSETAKIPSAVATACQGRDEIAHGCPYRTIRAEEV